ncbi:MAG: outer membrane beta-barrel protein [Deferribacterales bacterium]
MFISAVSFAQNYPAVGTYNENYQKVFDLMKQGQCSSMDGALADLEAAEGISGNIYRSLCFFDNGADAEGYKVFGDMLAKEEYDEVLYVCSYMEKQGKKSALLNKYKGSALYNIGDTVGAEKEYRASLDQAEDTETRYMLVDLLLAKGDTENAEAELAKASVKDSGYFFRMGQCDLKNGRFVSAYGDFRQVDKTAPEYPKAQNYLAAMCTATSRFICAEKSVENIASADGYQDTAKVRADALAAAKKPISLFLMLKEEFDNNVTSVDEDAVNSATEETSFRTSAVADIKYNIYTPYADKMTVGLFNYKSWNHSLSSYNLQMHKAYFMVKQGYDNFDITLPMISAAVTYFGGEKYSETFALEASADYKMDGLTLTVPVKIESRNYFSDTSEGDYDKDGILYAVSAKAVKTFLKKYSAGLSFGVETDDADGFEKDSTSYITELTGSARINDKWSVNASAQYTFSDYTDSSENREDDRYKTDLNVIYKINRSFFVTGGITWENKNSTTDAYDYEKTVLSTAIGYSY